MKRNKEKKKNKMSSREQWGHTLFAIKYLYKTNKGLFFIRIPMLILQTVSVIIPIFFIRQIVNEITIGKDIKKVLLYAVVMAIATFAANVIVKCCYKYDAKQHEITTYTMKKQLAKTVIDMPYSATEDPEVKNRIFTIQYNKFEETLAYFTGFLGALINVTGLSSVILIINPFVFVVIIIASVIRTIIDNKQREIPWRFNKTKAPIERHLDYYQSLMQDPWCGKEIRSNNLEEWLKEEYKACWKNEFYAVFKKFTVDMDRFSAYNRAVTFIQEGLAYLILAYEVIFHSMTVGDFSMYLSSASQLYNSVMGAAGCYHNLMGQAWITSKFRECIELSERLRIESGTKPVGKPDKVKIEFCDVSFKYPNTDRMILNNINLTIEPGETLSIVGVNGAGKTTFVKLLCRFYEPTEGKILINGIPANELSLEEYSNLLSVVFQDFKLFPFSVHENISMSEEYDSKRMQISIEKAGLSERIERLPTNVDTMLYKTFDSNGIELSGGEGQKLAIARALYRDTPIVIFDEPTSALDPIAEYDIYKNFDKLRENRSAIYISHRLSATRFTDKIAVFSDGELCEYGSHDELMRIENGVYKNMFEMQAQYYI